MITEHLNSEVMIHLIYKYQLTKYREYVLSKRLS
jgi:hypothetical protein